MGQVYHKNLSGTDLHTPKAHVSSHQSGASDALSHNNLASISGGAAADYYHITTAQHTELVNLLNALSVASDIITVDNFIITPSSAPTADYQVANKKYVDDNFESSVSWANLTVAGAPLTITGGSNAVAVATAITFNYDTNDFQLSGNNLQVKDSGIDHDSLTNTHNLTTDINHDQLTNFTTAEHFTLGETSTTAYRGDRGKTGYDHSQTTHDYAYITGNDAATNITAAELEELTDGSSTTLHTHAGSSDEKVKASSNDTTANYLDLKLLAGGGIIITENADGGDESLTLEVDTSLIATKNYVDSAVNKELYWDKPSGTTTITPLTEGDSLNLGIGNLIVNDITINNPSNIYALSHDSFADFVANEHLDWTTDQGATNIHSGNYTDTTYTPGEGIDIVSEVISGEDATTSNKGIASFNTDDFTVSSGAVSLKSASIADGDIATDADILLDKVGITIDGAGSAISTGIKGYIEVPYACTITKVTMLADQSGSAVVDIWKDTYDNYPPTDADSITASAVPTISTATKSQDSTLTGWTTTITAGDILGFNVDSAATITRLHLILTVKRT